MGLIDNLRGIFKRTTLQNVLYQNLYSYFGNGTIIAAEDNDRGYIKQGYESNPSVYSVIDLISTKAAKVPFILYRIEADGTKTKVERHPILDLIERPNPFYNARISFLKLFYTYRLTTGNGYLYAPRLSDGRAIEMYVMPSDKTEIVTAGWFDPIRGYRINNMSSYLEIEANDVMHVKSPTLDFETGREFYGMSPLKPLLRTVEKDNTGAESQKQMMGNQGASGILYPDDANATAPDDATWEKTQGKVDNRYNNSTNKGKVMLFSTKTGYINLGLTSVELGMLEDARFNLETICRVYHVPLAVMTSDAATFDNYKTSRKALYTDAVLPLVEEFTDAFNGWLVKAFGNDLILDYDTSGIEELQQDLKETVGWLQQAYWVDVYRKQEITGEMPDENMKGVYLVPAGLAPIDELTAPIQVPPLTDDDSTDREAQA